MTAERLIRVHYAQARTILPDAAIAVLHVGDEQTAVAWGRGREPQETMLLGLGAKKTAGQYFLHHPPAPLEMELAIAAIEDEVMRLRHALPAGTTLVSLDTALRQMGRMAEVAAPVVPLDTIEQVYHRLAALSLGRPISQEAPSLDAAFYLRVLLVREFMHHLGFAAITLAAAR